MEKAKANFWMPAQLKADLEVLAVEYGGNFSSYVNMVLTAHVRTQKAMKDSGMIERVTKAMEGVAGETIERLLRGSLGEEAVK